MKQLFRQFVLSLFILGLVLPVWAQSYPFNDVSHKHPAYKEIYLLNKYNFLPGITYERFGGELNYNRFHLSETLDAMLGNQEISATNIFILSDVSPNSPRYKTVSRVLQAGLVELDTSSFEGLRPITRYELAYSIYQLLRFKSAPVPPPRETNIKFRDVSAKYKDAVEHIANVWQITEGYPNGQFKGDNRVTRYEAAFMLDKVAAILYQDYQEAKTNSPIPKPPIQLQLDQSPTPDGSAPAIIKPSNNKTLDELLGGSPSPVAQPSLKPSTAPSGKPSVAPSTAPTLKPTAAPSVKPTLKPTTQPSVKPSVSSSMSDLEKLLNGSAKPSVKPSTAPPSGTPSTKPTLAPAATPTPRPSASIDISKIPDIDITGSALPSVKPSAAPTLQPTVKPSVKPSAKPSAKPSVKPSVKPSLKPSVKPSLKPTAKPSVKPTVKPTVKPSPQPSAKPSAQSSDPAAIQSSLPTPRPSALSDLEQRLRELRESSKPAITPSAKPEQPDSLVDIPLPSARPTATPEPQSTPKPIESNLLPNVSLKKRPPLDNRVLLLGNWRLLYEERVPDNIMTALSMPASSQSISGDAGISARLNSMFWFGEPNTPMGNLGLVFDLASMGGFQFNGADLTDTLWADAGVMYKLVSSESFDFAAGLEGYYRITESSNDPRNNYFQASRSYIGMGTRLTSAWRVWDPLTLELTIAPHYVIQDLSNIQLSELPLNRFDTQVQFLINWDIFDIGSSKMSLDVGYQGLFLFDLGSEASQIMHGVLFGAGYHF